MEGGTPKEMLALISRMEMQQALFACRMYMEKVEKDGGIAAVIQDIKDSSGATLSPDDVKHAMACGGAIMLMLTGAAYKAAYGSTPSADESAGPTDLKSEQDAERAAREAIDRIRKLH
jgi:hypothetical protein